MIECALNVDYWFSPKATEEGSALRAEPSVTVREARESKSHKSLQIKQIKKEKRFERFG